ncbi:DDE_3 domain-containing protein [Nephila pilipes]|uniref:DDE_3 domain-containing protein n=1 Tax=Nephila pilipes TaxID=299642 RepID=A0A8X6PXY1_NEPPI|nr:DDE_3 domain-containing protein [Nephila pilipes]
MIAEQSNWEMSGKHSFVVFEGFFLIVWLTPFGFCAGTPSTEDHVDILDNSELLTLSEPFGEGLFLFQMDDAPIHTTRQTQRRFIDMGIKELGWPSRGPDVNLIGYQWDVLERRLNSRLHSPNL